jgi:hypothetical protein
MAKRTDRNTTQLQHSSAATYCERYIQYQHNFSMPVQLHTADSTYSINTTSECQCSYILRTVHTVSTQLQHSSAATYCGQYIQYQHNFSMPVQLHTADSTYSINTNSARQCSYILRTLHTVSTQLQHACGSTYCGQYIQYQHSQRRHAKPFHVANMRSAQFLSHVTYLSRYNSYVSGHMN